MYPQEVDNETKVQEVYWGIMTMNGKRGKQGFACKVSEQDIDPTSVKEKKRKEVQAAGTEHEHL